MRNQKDACCWGGGGNCLYMRRESLDNNTQKYKTSVDIMGASKSSQEIIFCNSNLQMLKLKSLFIFVSIVIICVTKQVRQFGVAK